MKKWLVILITLAIATLVLCILSCKATKINAVYTVKIYVDGSVYSEYSAKYGSEIELPEIESTDDEGNVFLGWFANSNYDEWFTATTISKNVDVYGYWTTYEESLVSVSFYDEDMIIKGFPISVQIGSCIESYPLPDTDDGYSLDVWLVNGKPYDFNSRVLSDVNLYSTRKPTEFTVEFLSLGECISTQIYTVENYNITVPACPDRDHYYPGEWESYELSMGNVQVNAIYEPIPYTVEYIDGTGTVLGVIDYNILNYKDVVPPEPTPVPGCYSYWDELECGVTQLRQKVTALDYTIEYYAKDNLIAAFETNIYDYYELEAPEIPQIAGYTSSWEEYKLQLETYIRVNAVYELITYYVSFVSDDEVLEVFEYNVENTEVEIPETPEKRGYTCEWETFHLEIGDVTVNALFTPIDYTARFILFDELIGTEYSLTYTTTFNADNMVIDFPDTEHYPTIAGCAVKWDNPKLDFEDILINGYYYDVDYTYLNFVQVKNVDEEENVTEHYFYITGPSKNASGIINAVIPDKYHNIPVTHIEPYAFSKANFKTLEIYGVEKIGAYAFAQCDSLQSVIMHDGIQVLDQYSFAYCSHLISINIPDTVTQIGISAFSSSGLVNVTLSNSLEIILPTTFYHCDDLVKIVIPDSVKEICTDAFNSCYSLTDVTLGSGVEIIRNSAFAHCSALKEITIPDSTYLIESFAFNGCTELNKINVLSGDWYSFRNNDMSDSALTKIPESILFSGEDLAGSIKDVPGIGLYRKIV
ncbi:MAG: leucine-rich repeat domain-containing protein [Clostridia bacterium]|nr:leucine-rich repeat domain-containing protein [Clostridia bacterium]